MAKDSPPEVSKADWDRAKSRFAAAKKYHEEKMRVTPKREDIIAEFGRAAVKDHPDGSWSASIKHDKAKMMRAERMFKGQRKVDSERAEDVQANIEKTRVQINGKPMDLYSHLADEQARRTPGARPMTRTQNPRSYFPVAADKYERGPDGLHFLWNGGWEPTNLWRNGAVSPQRDPDGNVWAEQGGEWVLMEEYDGAAHRDADSGTG